MFSQWIFTLAYRAKLRVISVRTVRQRTQKFFYKWKQQIHYSHILKEYDIGRKVSQRYRIFACWKECISDVDSNDILLIQNEIHRKRFLLEVCFRQWKDQVCELKKDRIRMIATIALKISSRNFFHVLRNLIKANLFIKKKIWLCWTIGMPKKLSLNDTEKLEKIISKIFLIKSQLLGA
jgi:hypothetical protein